jgi:hypothetical protein
MLTTGLVLSEILVFYTNYISKKIAFEKYTENILNYASRNEQKVEQGSWLDQIYLNKNWTKRYVNHAFIGYLNFIVGLIIGIISIIADGFFDHFEVSIYLLFFYLLFDFVSDSYLVQYSYVNRIDPD